MSGLLSTLLAFVGIILILALAAQSIQEIIKTMFTFKGTAQLTAIEGLVKEAVRQKGQYSIDAEAILAEIQRRLSALGQNAWRKGKVRLDEIGPESLKDLIESVPVSALPGLPVGKTEAEAALAEIAKQAHKWFPLAVRPVDARYRRRMRVLALLSSALVVIPANAGADRMFGLARSDPAFRATVDSMVAALEAIPDTATVPDTTRAGVAGGPAEGSEAADTAARADTATDTAADTTARPPADTATDTAADTTAGPAADTAAVGVTRSARAAAALELLRANRSGFFSPPARADFGRLSWWIGIALMVLLVSMGAPFWHDVLESLFGLKNRIRAQAQQVKEEVRANDQRAPINQPT
jgi:hypothetical protein